MARSESVFAQINIAEGLEETAGLFRDFESQPQGFQDFLNSARRPQMVSITATKDPAAIEKLLRLFFDAGLADYYYGDDKKIHAGDEFTGVAAKTNKSAGETVDHSAGPAFLLWPSDSSTKKTKTGGVPTNVSPFDWPKCRSCKGNMLFVGQINLSETQIETLAKRRQTLLVFQCTNNPGMCDDWEPNAGGNAAILVRNGKKTIKPPKSGETTLDVETLVQFAAHDASECTETDDDKYVAAYESGDIVGKSGGNPVWIQDDETPNCECGETMRFVALLEERGGLSFGGGGAGYTFVCEKCKSAAKFLWQR